jgi:hypothetical protein
MTRFRLWCVPLALFAVGGSARAQHAGGSPVPNATSTSGSHGHSAAAPSRAQTAGGAWTGTASKWGGSPPQAPVSSQARAYAIPSAYLLDGIASPLSAPQTLVVDTVYTAPVSAVAGDVSAKVTARETRQLTTMEVYRQQRFGKP